MERTDIPKSQWDLLYAAYGTTYSPEDFLAKYIDLMRGIAELPFVVGFCYTQLTDVEQERNGLLTYDRKLKVDEGDIREVNQKFLAKKHTTSRRKSTESVPDAVSTMNALQTGSTIT